MIYLILYPESGVPDFFFFLMRLSSELQSRYSLKISDEPIGGCRFMLFLILRIKLVLPAHKILFLVHMVSNSVNDVNYNESVYCAQCIKGRKELINLNYYTWGNRALNP